MNDRPLQNASPLAPPASSSFASLGFTRPSQGSLGWPFTAALVGGIGVAIAIGLLKPDPPITDWMLLAALLLWQPAIEETLFRGLLQGYLARMRFGAYSFAGISAANVVTSIAFTTVHFVHQPPLWALGVFFPSMLFGYFRDLSGSVWPSLALHVAFNAAFFLA